MRLISTLPCSSWDDDEDVEGSDGDEGEEGDGGDEGAPTPALLPCLSLLSTHLAHLIPSLPKVNSNAVYRRIANSLASSIVDRVILAGGSHRFSQRGALRLRQDVLQGWMCVVADVAAAESRRLGSNTTTSLGRKPEAPWRLVLDASQLLSLPKANAAGVTLSQASDAAFDSPSAWTALLPVLQVDDRMDIRTVQEILRRRIDCPR